MRRLTMLFAILCAATFAHAQKIESKKMFGGYKYTQNGKTLTMGNLVSTMKTNPEAYRLIKKANTNQIVATIIGAAGGGLTGWPLGAAVGGGDPNWALAGIGAGLVAVSIPFATTSNKKAREAVEVYNSSLSSSYKFSPEFKISSNRDGIGFAIVF